jgi:hypothetical protein
MKKVQAIKDRWAARMQVVCKGKCGIGNDVMPNADGVPEQVLQLFAGLPVLNS